MQGILFNYELGMWKSTLEGTKDETRRLVKRELPDNITDYSSGYTAFTPKGYISLRGKFDDRYGEWFLKPRYQVGEIVYLKEPFTLEEYETDLGPVYGKVYKYDDPTKIIEGRWMNKLFMGENDARYFAKITQIRVERLHDITEYSCLREGIIEVTKDGNIKKYCIYDKGDYSSVPWSEMPYTAKEAYQWLWDKINKKKCPWSSNPWVFVYNYKLLEGKK